MNTEKHGSIKKTQMIAKEEQHYFEFLRYCLREDLDNGSVIPACVADISWHDLLAFAKKQTLVGVCWRGVSTLGGLTTNKPTDDDVLEWMAVVKKVNDQNRVMFERVGFVSRTFASEGFRSCILKGQGNALMYPDPMMRQSGDIDIWLEGRDTDIIAYVRNLCPKAKACYHHIDFDRVKNATVEVHYRPSFMNNLINNARLQKYFAEVAPMQFENKTKNLDGMGDFCIPTPSFNRIFQMAHISNHFFQEGIGLRQLVDYFYLLRQGFSEEERQHDVKVLKRCGLYRITRAVMYVAQTVFGLEDRYLLAPPDRRLGRQLLREVIEAGNFGQHDERAGSGSAFGLQRNVNRLLRDVRFLFWYPSECLWEPVFRVWHYFWRRRH